MVREQRPRHLGERTAGHRRFAVAFVAHLLGPRITYTYKVREMGAERFVMSTAEAPFPIKATYSWLDTHTSGTRMTLRNQGEPSGFGANAPIPRRRLTARCWCWSDWQRGGHQPLVL